jgi:sarcosine oxidase subunit beta
MTNKGNRVASETADIIVIGGGLIGMATAYELSRRGAGRLVVLEKGPGVAMGSTGSSSACLRLRYTHAETMTMALHGQDTYRDWAAYTGLQSPRAAMDSIGVLWMLGEDRATVEAERERLISIGARAQTLDRQSLADRFPALSTCTTPIDFQNGTDHDCGESDSFLFEEDGGYCTDPAGANQDLLEACRRDGVDVRLNTQVIDIRMESGHAIGVTSGDGHTIDAPQIVNAAGPWCNRLNDNIGLGHTWNLVPTRAQVMLRATVEPLPGGLPMVADAAGGVYFRPDNNGQQILVGSTRSEDETETIDDPDSYKTAIDDDTKQRLLHGLHHRIPGLQHRGRVTGVAGMYTINQQDVHPVLGKTHIEGYYVSNGYSGHGFKLGPAVGNLLAQIITDTVVEGDVHVDHSFLSIDREPLAVREKTVLA